jgi:hypothetical protein
LLPTLLLTQVGTRGALPQMDAVTVIADTLKSAETTRSAVISAGAGLLMVAARSQSAREAAAQTVHPLSIKGLSSVPVPANRPSHRKDKPMKSTILFLAANPSGTTQLALDEECRQITEKIRAGDRRDLQLITRWAVRPDDLLQHLHEHRPHVVHFSGHGTASEELVLLDKDRKPKPVSVQALRQLFGTLKDNIRVVLLNACFSRPQAEAITEVIDCAIGMNRAIGDDAAIAFAAAFYQALSFDRSVDVAFESGKAALMLAGIAEEQTPELLCKEGVDPATVVPFPSEGFPQNPA